MFDRDFLYQTWGFVQALATTQLFYTYYIDSYL